MPNYCEIKTMTFENIPVCTRSDSKYHCLINASPDGVSVKLNNNIGQVDFFPIFSDIYLVPDIK